MFRSIAIAAALIATLVPIGWAKECSKAEAQTAHFLAPDIRTWRALYDAFRRYGHCDDGAIAGGFSESTSLILADNWSSLKVGAELMNRDPKFKSFVFRHLGEVTPRDRWEKIVRNASGQCAKENEALCKQLTTK